MRKWAVRLFLLTAAVGILLAAVPTALLVLPVEWIRRGSLREAWTLYAATLVDIAFGWWATWCYPTGVDL